MGRIFTSLWRCNIGMQWQQDIWPSSVFKILGIQVVTSAVNFTPICIIRMVQVLPQLRILACRSCTIWYCRFLEDLLKIKVYAAFVDCRFPVETECIWIQVTRFALRYVGLTWPLFKIGHLYLRGTIWQALLVRTTTKITRVTMRSDYVFKIHITNTSLGIMVNTIMSICLYCDR